MSITKDKLATLCLWWAVTLLLGIVAGVNAPFILMLAWSVLILL